MGNDFCALGLQCKAGNGERFLKYPRKVRQGIIKEYAFEMYLEEQIELIIVEDGFLGET
jgi:hypothetical protein